MSLIRVLTGPAAVISRPNSARVHAVGLGHSKSETKERHAMYSFARFIASPRRLLVIGLALTSTLFFSASAMAALKGPFTVFAQCPRFTKGVERCLAAEIESGSVTIGSTEVPIKNKITLQGGIETNETTGAEHLVAALNGETLTKAPQKVPGGLLGLDQVQRNQRRGWLEMEPALPANSSSKTRSPASTPRPNWPGRRAKSNSACRTSPTKKAPRSSCR